MEATEIAITDDPAIEQFFLKFSGEPLKIEFNTDKQIITGPVMIPNSLIYRNDALGERFVMYDEDGVKKAASLFMRNGSKFNSEHSDNKLPQVEILESYFTKIDNEFGVPENSWVVSAKINDLNLWEKLKSNDMGFSVESMFSNELIGMEELKFNNNLNKNKMDLKEKLMAAVNAVLFGEVKEVVEEVKVEMAADPVVETPLPKDAPTTSPTLDEIKAMITDSIAAAYETIMQEVESKITEVCAPQDAKLVEMSAQLVEFGKQPITQPITTETVDNTTTGSSFDYLKGVSLK